MNYLNIDRIANKENLGEPDEEVGLSMFGDA